MHALERKLDDLQVIIDNKETVIVMQINWLTDKNIANEIFVSFI